MTPFATLIVQPAADAPLSPAQQRFQDLLARVGQLTAQLQHLQAWADAHRAPHLRALHASAQQANALRKDLLQALHERLQTVGAALGPNSQSEVTLTAQQQRWARRAIGQLLAALQPSADPQVQALAECYADPEAEQERAEALQQEAKRLCQELEALLGRPIEGASHCHTPDQVMAAAMRQWQRQQDKDDARKTAKRAAKQAEKSKKAHHAHQSKHADGAATDASPDSTPPPLDPRQALRTLYRQLASALHPDREPDEALRLQKTEWMSQANAAYERGDLTALLQLQMTHLQSSPTPDAPNAQDALNAASAQTAAQSATPHTAKLHRMWEAMSPLLKTQVKALEDDLAQLAARLSHELRVPVRTDADAQTQAPELARALAQQLQHAQHTAHSLQADIRSAQSDAEFKRWLKAQDQAFKAQARQAD